MEEYQATNNNTSIEIKYGGGFFLHGLTML